MENSYKGFKVETEPTNIDWDGFERDVIGRMRLLRDTWNKVPDAVRVRLYVPLFLLLSRFCAPVEIQPDGTTK